jgi:hypothetical protein
MFIYTSEFIPVYIYWTSSVLKEGSGNVGQEVIILLIQYESAYPPHLKFRIVWPILMNLQMNVMPLKGCPSAYHPTSYSPSYDKPSYKWTFNNFAFVLIIHISAAKGHHQVTYTNQQIYLYTYFKYFNRLHLMPSHHTIRIITCYLPVCQKQRI